MKHYFVFELRKLLARWQFGIMLLLALLLTGAYTANFFEIIVQRYAVIHRLKPGTSFGLYFFHTLSNRINFILVVSCALVSTLAWESETGATLQRALKLTPGKVHLLLTAKILICLVLLAMQIGFLWLIISWSIVPFMPMLRGDAQFTQTTLAHFLGIQYIWLIPILLLNVCWYIWLGDRAVIVFAFALAGVYLLGFISFTPFHTFLSHGYGQVSTHMDDAIWLVGWTVGLLLFLRKQLVNYA